MIYWKKSDLERQSYIFLQATKKSGKRYRPILRTALPSEVNQRPYPLSLSPRVDYLPSALNQNPYRESSLSLSLSLSFSLSLALSHSLSLSLPPHLSGGLGEFWRWPSSVMQSPKFHIFPRGTVGHY